MKKYLLALLLMSAGNVFSQDFDDDVTGMIPLGRRCGLTPTATGSVR